MTKKDFEKIRRNNEKINILENQIDDLNNESTVKGQNITGMPFVSGTSDKVGEYITRLTELEDKLMILSIRTYDLIKKAKIFLNDIPDDTIRLALYFIYLKDMDILETADMLGIYGVKREKTLNKIINTFFLECLLYM